MDLVSEKAGRDARGGGGCGPFLIVGRLFGQLFAKTFEALQPLTALASPKAGPPVGARIRGSH